MKINSGSLNVRACRDVSSQGRTKEEAITNIREAVQGYIEALEEDHLPVPEERFETILVAI